MTNHKYLILVLLAATILSGCVDSQSRQIQVSATAQVKAAPELVVFDFMIEERGKELAPLKARVDRKAAALVKLCKRLGIKPKDLTAAEVSIQPQYHYNSGRFTGYHVSRNVSAYLYDLSKYTKVVNGAVKAGITTIQNISLQLKEEHDLENKALAKAVASGTDKARLLAKQNGVQLGKILQISESSAGVYQKSYELKKRSTRTGMVAEYAPNVFEPGQLSVSKTVHLTFEIE